MQVAEEKLNEMDSLSRLGHYVAVLENSWTSVDQNATDLLNDLDEALEVMSAELFRKFYNDFFYALKLTIRSFSFIRMNILMLVLQLM